MRKGKGIFDEDEVRDWMVCEVEVEDKDEDGCKKEKIEKIKVKSESEEEKEWKGKRTTKKQVKQNVLIK